MSDLLTEIDEVTQCIIIMALLIFWVSLLCLIGTNCQKRAFLKRWNNGYDITDGGKWRMSQAVGHKSGTSYIYKCTKCDAWLELDTPQFNWIEEENEK